MTAYATGSEIQIHMFNTHFPSVSWIIHDFHFFLPASIGVAFSCLFNVTKSIPNHCLSGL